MDRFAVKIPHIGISKAHILSIFLIGEWPIDQQFQDEIVALKITDAVPGLIKDRCFVNWRFYNTVL
jgi:hypothetical protein